MHGSRWNVPLEDIPSGLGRMTCSQVIRNAKAPADHVQICFLVNCNREAGFREMPNPAGAAAAVRIFVNQDRCGLGGGSVPW